MSTQFNITRFGMLFKKHTVENLKNYALSLFVLVGILVIVVGLANYNVREPMGEKQQIAFFLGFLLAAGLIFTSNVFANLGEKRKAIAAITLPASALEKFLVGWVYSYLIFQIVFIATFYAVIALILKLGNWPAGSAPIVNLFSEQNKIYIVFIIYAFLHAIVIYGAIFFSKMHFIKTAFAFFILVVVVWLLNIQVLKIMFGDLVSSNPPFTGIFFKYSSSPGHADYANINTPYETYKWIFALFGLLAVMFWSAAYFRLKEKKV